MKHATVWKRHHNRKRNLEAYSRIKLGNECTEISGNGQSLLSIGDENDIAKNLMPNGIPLNSYRKQNAFNREQRWN